MSAPLQDRSRDHEVVGNGVLVTLTPHIRSIKSRSLHQRFSSWAAPRNPYTSDGEAANAVPAARTSHVLRRVWRASSATRPTIWSMRATAAGADARRQAKAAGFLTYLPSDQTDQTDHEAGWYERRVLHLVTFIRGFRSLNSASIPMIPQGLIGAQSLDWPFIYPLLPALSYPLMLALVPARDRPIKTLLRHDSCRQCRPGSLESTRCSSKVNHYGHVW